MHAAMMRTLLSTALLAVLATAGCASAELTEAQKEGVAQRRYCEAHPDDVAACLGFLGFH